MQLESNIKPGSGSYRHRKEENIGLYNLDEPFSCKKDNILKQNIIRTKPHPRKVICPGKDKYERFIKNIPRINSMISKNIKDQNKKLESYKRIFNENNEIYILEEELNPLFYNQLVKESFPLAKDKLVNIICGPYIAVEDELFKKYHNIHNKHLGNWWYAKRKGQWWKIHPLFERAYNNKNINIFIKKQRIPERNFYIGFDSKEIIIEEPHDELSNNYSITCSKHTDLLKRDLDKWQNIRNENCYKWDKTVKGKLLFKPINKFKREQEIGEKIDKELQSLKISPTL